MQLTTEFSVYVSKKGRIKVRNFVKCLLYRFFAFSNNFLRPEMKYVLQIYLKNIVPWLLNIISNFD